MSENKGKSQGIRSVLDHFLQRIDSLESALPMTILILEATRKAHDNNFSEFEKENIIRDEESKIFRVEQENFKEFKRLSRKKVDSRIALEIVPRSFLAALVGQYDAFLGRLISELMMIKPDMLNNSDRKMTYSTLSKFEDINEARKYIVEKEVESVLRKSHSDHFDWLETKFDMPLRKNLSVWSTFVEITERRNLFAHTDGIVPSQYIDVCHKNNVEIGDVKVGDKLKVDKNYFEKAFSAMYELSVKLTHVLWRKLIPGERRKADGELIDITYNLLDEEKFELARVISDFSVITIKRRSSELNRRKLVINRAQAYMWLGEKGKAAKIIDSEDWSAMSDMFQLAVAVIKEEYDKAARLVRDIGSESNEMSIVAYKDWPLFRDFRNTSDFNEAYRDITGYDFNRSGIESEHESIDDRDGDGDIDNV